MLLGWVLDAVEAGGRVVLVMGASKVDGDVLEGNWKTVAVVIVALD